MKVLYQKLWCATIVLMMGIIGFKAHAHGYSLVLNLADGTAATFPLSDHPIIKNSPTELSVESENAAITVAYKDLINFILTDMSKAEDLTIEDNHQIIGGSIFFSGLKEGEPIIIYSTEGKIMTSANADSDGTAIIDLSSFGTGMYIARCNNSSFKFINK